MRHLYADFVHRVNKPARYLGGEYQSVTKTGAMNARVCLAFPDVYDIGMSHLGTKILYSLLNKEADIACERAFVPWLDMEAELRERNLPLVSLETQTVLADFDVLGISLQYEMTFTNMLTLLDLGRVGLHAAERPEDGPLVIVGGSVASHPEPVAPFIDAAFLGEAEAQLPGLVRAWAVYRQQIRAGHLSRREALIQMAQRYAMYVPSLYQTVVDADTGMTVVGAPLDARVPARVERAMIRNLDDYPFPVDAPVPYAEAVFERASVEIARGCTEGCRFCQAGMIYRPVRERSPESIEKSLLEGVDRAGYEETGLTCLSTADFSAITPLVKRLAEQLRSRGVSMSVASLRAYGLSEVLLDELATTRIAGLTFAPEAGSQRMRDVVNKNITLEHIDEAVRRVFSRGWHRVKLYFMIGLPTEEDIDVDAIMDLGRRALATGRELVGGRAEVAVSVSSHVPKPHTPYQWCAQNHPEEIRRKQDLLRTRMLATQKRGDRSLKLKMHHNGISFVEGILARGDRRLAPVIEHAWRAGARFDGWDEVFDVSKWDAAMNAVGLSAIEYLATRPVTARLPWDHLDVGLEDGFLLSEYRKALKGRASPPCGKVAGALVHHTNLADASADRRKLVCYDCGVACDLTTMRDDRLVKLRALGAHEPFAPKPPEAAQKANQERKARVERAGHVGFDAPYKRFRIRYAKVGRAAFLGHLDMLRLWTRMFRRASLPLAQTRGFSPGPRLSFGPALGLGIPSLAELMDADIEQRTVRTPAGAPSEFVTAEEVARALAEVAPEGLVIEHVDEIPTHEPTLGKTVAAVDLVIQPPPRAIAWSARELLAKIDAFNSKPTCLIDRDDKHIDLRGIVLHAELVDEPQQQKFCGALDWPERHLIRVRLAAGNGGSARPEEVARAFGLWGADDLRAPHANIARLGVAMTQDLRRDLRAELTKARSQAVRLESSSQ